MICYGKLDKIYDSSNLESKKSDAIVIYILYIDLSIAVTILVLLLIMNLWSLFYLLLVYY